MKIYIRLLLIALSVALLWLSFPLPDLGFLAWIALTPALIAINGVGRGKGFLLGWLFGASFMAVVANWFLIFGALPLIVGSIFFGLYFALFFAIYGWFTRKYPPMSSWQTFILPPLLWIFLEWLKSQGVLGFTWGDIGLTQYRFLSLLQLASVFSVYGISFVVVFVNNLIAETIFGIAKYTGETGIKPWTSFPGLAFWKGIFGVFREMVKSGGEYPYLRNAWLAFAFIFPAILILGRLWIPLQLGVDDYESLTDKSLDVGVVQVNMPQNIKWEESNLVHTLAILAENTKSLAQSGAKLIVWPETAIPHRDPLSYPLTTEFIYRIPRENNIHLVTGIIGREGKDVYNTVILVNPDGNIAGRYNKIHLVPLGEYFPLPEKYRKYKIFDRIGKYSHGKEVKVFESPYGNFQVLICFESMFSYLARLGGNKGAQFLLVLTNDAWFLRSNAAKIHFIMAIFRAVENRVWVVQAGNTGVSGIIDPWGRVLKETQIFTRETVQGKIYPLKIKTLFSFWGNILPILGGIVAAILILQGIMLRREAS